MGGGDQCLPVLCGTAEADLLGAVAGAYSDGSSWDRVFSRGVYPESGSMMENDKKAARA